MSKQKRSIITIVSLILILAVSVVAFFIISEDPPKDNNNSTVISEVLSSVTIENIESTVSSDDTAESKNEKVVITPDETEADKLLQNNSTASSNEKAESKAEKTESKVEEPKPTIKNPEPSETVEETQTFEESKEELEDTIDDYLTKHNIDPKTAGETGEICPNCNKKIWNPDKYGFYIPGMPEDYENSGYCLGTCGISLE